jgi:DNA adenine methylase
MSNKKENLRTFIKWSGNKSKHLRHIIPLLPTDYNNYIEPFLGSGALFLKLKPKKYIINDLNRDNIETWKLIKNNPNKIINAFKTFGKTFKKMNKKQKLLTCRKQTESLNCSVISETRTCKYLLMKACVYMGNILIKDRYYFKGLELGITVNNNHPFLTENYYKNIKNVSEYLNKNKGQIYNADYKKILKKAKKNDFVFLDPPYVEKKDYCFNYNKNEILDQDFINELVQQVKILDKRDVYWIMTQANTKQVRKAFANYKIKTFDVYRAVSKSYTKELIIMNY